MSISVPVLVRRATVALILYSVLISAQHRIHDDVFPVHGALFLPYDYTHRPPVTAKHSDDEKQHHLATVDSVLPIIDIAILDAYHAYLHQWTSRDHWMTVIVAPVKECDDQKTAAWAALEATQWTNGSGLDVAFGPACDYVLATVSRILSYSAVPMFTSAGFSEFFQNKHNELLTRVGPLQDHITYMIENVTTLFSWRHPHLLYQKSFWESELLEAGFCKMMMTGMYVRTVNKQWNLEVNPRMLPTVREADDKREVLKEYLKDTVGVDYGAREQRSSEGSLNCVVFPVLVPQIPFLYWIKLCTTVGFDGPFDEPGVLDLYTSSRALNESAQGSGFQIWNTDFNSKVTIVDLENSQSYPVALG
uniref:ANF_receptor domain-containing protein n=1 Tax=Steinernema glaseri TaxID=37863 RepID=A0A1I7Z925_9BILA